MKVINAAKQFLKNRKDAAQSSVETNEGTTHLSTMVNQKLLNLLQDVKHQTEKSVQIAAETRDGIANHSNMVNQKMEELILGVKHQLDESVQIAAETRDGIANHSTMVNQKMQELIQGIKHQTDVMNKLSRQFEGLQKSNVALNSSFLDDCKQSPPEKQSAGVGLVQNPQAQPAKIFEEEMRSHPLLFAPKTYNTSHPEYDANLVRNFPGKVFNSDIDPMNPIFDELKKIMHGNEIDDEQWNSFLQQSLEEAKSVPHAEQVFQRQAYIESYLAALEANYEAFYRPGWVNLNDALFLYWTVRRLKPKVIVQAGVCNGLSAAFMMLALAKNGPEGRLYAVDMPPVFDSNDDAWKVKGKVYGVTIPEGKSSGWIVPDAYQSRFEVQSGDAKLLLPGLLKKLNHIDMFYHDSDHTYDHMMFEFTEAKKYLNKSGVIVSDDISWNASLWDFADQHQVPAYNYKGSMGIACF